MKNSPLLSIVVPSKNRHYYLKFLVEYFHSVKSDKIELIIQDNSGEEHIQDFKLFLNSINDERIKYLSVTRDLSVIENCDLAIVNSSGEYVTMLGDDDVFSKHIIEFTENFKKENLDAVLPIKGSYTWPDVTPRFYGKTLSGSFRVNNFDSKRVRINVKIELNKVIKLGGTDILNLPRVYHGIVKRNILEKVYQKTNSYFPGPSPDMANAIALSAYVKNFEIINVPLLISGHSFLSTGGQGAQGQHFGEIKNIKHLPKDTATNWTEKIPFYWSGYTIYAESIIKSLNRMDMKDYLKRFNYDYMLAACFVYDISYKDRINLVYRKCSFSNRSRVNYYIFIVWAKRVLFHLNKNIKWLYQNVLFKDFIFKKSNILEVAILTDDLIDIVIKKKNLN